MLYAFALLSPPARHPEFELRRAAVSKSGVKQNPSAPPAPPPELPLRHLASHQPYTNGHSLYTLASVHECRCAGIYRLTNTVQRGHIAAGVTTDAKHIYRKRPGIALDQESIRHFGNSLACRTHRKGRERQDAVSGRGIETGVFTLFPARRSPSPFRRIPKRRFVPPTKRLFFL
jgi:hypothetical protein